MRAGRFFKGMLLAGAVGIGVMGSMTGLPHRSRAAPAGHAAKAGTLAAVPWQAWRDRFVAEDGRVVDDANRGISHSEGQGYGLLLAYLAGDRVAFARIWAFTQTELLLRDDGLAAWRWDPAAKPHVTDVNDAADGDILIAYALALAGESWGWPAYVEVARGMAEAIGHKLVREVDGQTVLMPGATGFGDTDRPDGPVVNLSYWLFEAFPVLAQLAPETEWGRLEADGRRLVAAARFGPAGLPPDWLSLHDTPKPSTGFAPHFGYDAIRVPLYLMRAGLADRALLGAFARAWSSGTPSVVRLDDGVRLDPLAEPGYRMVAAMLACLLDGRPIPPDLKNFAPTSYYPSTLHLLALAGVAQIHGSCL